FNGDGLLDLAVANTGSNSASILIGNGNGTFQGAQHFAVGANPRSIILGDFNGDGFPDLATANEGSNNVSILIGNGDGTFQTARHFAVGGRGPWSVTAGDFDRDGQLDLAVANWGYEDCIYYDPKYGCLQYGHIAGTTVSVLLGQGDGTFRPAQNFIVGSSPQYVAVGDFNGDQILDLATANADTNNVSVLVGIGDGTFRPAQHFAAGSGPSALAVGDFNGDGLPDLAVTNFNSNDVSVLINNTPSQGRTGLR